MVSILRKSRRGFLQLIARLLPGTLAVAFASHRRSAGAAPSSTEPPLPIERHPALLHLDTGNGLIGHWLPVAVTAGGCGPQHQQRLRKRSAQADAEIERLTYQLIEALQRSD